jgi:hypothetical protein
MTGRGPTTDSFQRVWQKPAVSDGLRRNEQSTTIGLKGTYPIVVVRAPVADTNSAVVTANFISDPVV